MNTGAEHLKENLIPAFCVEDLTLAYREKPVLWDIDVCVPQGAMEAVVGPNGAGKSTLINIITGILDPLNGEVLIGGHSIKKKPIEAKRLIGLVPQELALSEDISAIDNLNFFASLYGLSGKKLKEAAKNEAKNKANAYLAKIQNSSTLLEQAKQYDPNIKDSSTNLSNTTISTVTSNFGKEVSVWANSKERRSGDKAVIETEKGFVVVYLVEPLTKDESKLVNARHILVKYSDDEKDESARACFKNLAGVQSTCDFPNGYYHRRLYVVYGL